MPCNVCYDLVLVSRQCTSLNKHLVVVYGGGVWGQCVV